ncbi:MAG: hypothetical protein U1E05_11170 [Patescibacteria group bacterium]|nr:hypothetical protein [Patescibacteria group bacterium]
MIAPEMVERIRDLLADGHLSQRGIARELRVSRVTVDAIAHGRRNDRPPQYLDRPAWSNALPGPTERCPGCGARVQMPCLACRLHALQRLQRRSA